MESYGLEQQQQKKSNSTLQYTENKPSITRMLRDLREKKSVLLAPPPYVESVPLIEALPSPPLSPYFSIRENFQSLVLEKTMICGLG